ncbi:MAG: lytic transglycosylase domain-containing protein [Deltaproteobacteria bacterium]|nr:lytic transglycosylase domain-containing protein [Deltaproteobacteria bacterium]MBW2444308.1 lytic transglycosylase domain-containing protein [Deltaproteobacteria bacterium]
MSRWSLVFVAFWAMALTMRDDNPARMPHVSAPPAVAANSSMDGDAVARIVGSWNPSLSSVERQRIGAAVMGCEESYELDPTLVTAMIWVESRARPWARSPKGAMGLMQVMPYMAEPLGLAGNFTTIESNVEAGCRILSGNIERLGEADGVSAYFWGSNIRGIGYLNRVRDARERVRRELRSEGA